MIDYRSDTFTRPCKSMLEYMCSAPVGDDVFGEDPTINKLEAIMATSFGKEAAIFCPSGTMTNQIAIKCHTQPGDEVICDKLSHVYIYEGGGIAFNSGCSVKLIEGNHGRITAGQVLESINPHDIHKPNSSLVSLENTANRGGGGCYDFSEIKKIKEVCSEHGLALHLDGARLYNALVAKNESTQQYGQTFDSISICLSKGLGAPVGSVLVGSTQFIKKARRVRKVMGGGMRQAGYLAAACLYALEHNVERMVNDHLHAQQLYRALKQKDFVGNFLPVETNILIFEVIGRFTPALLVARLKDEDILAIAISKTQVRLVLHLDVTPQMVKKTLDIIATL